MKKRTCKILINIGSLWLAIVILISGMIMMTTHALEEGFVQGLLVFWACFFIFGLPGIILVIIGVIKQRSLKGK